MNEETLCLRKAQLNDLDAIKSLADANRYELGFVRRSALLSSIQNEWIIVAEQAGDVVGFVSYRHRQDTQTTVYEICVETTKRRNGIGHALIKALVMEATALGKSRIRLKAPTDLSANAFYLAVEFELINVESGKQRQLNIWEVCLKQKECSQ